MSEHPASKPPQLPAADTAIEPNPGFSGESVDAALKFVEANEAVWDPDRFTEAADTLAAEVRRLRESKEIVCRECDDQISIVDYCADCVTAAVVQAERQRILRAWSFQQRYGGDFRRMVESGEEPT